jgi:hypothetical protein
VLVDGVDGSIVEHFVEDNPEDWTSFALDEAASPPPTAPSKPHRSAGDDGDGGEGVEHGDPDAE